MAAVEPLKAEPTAARSTVATAAAPAPQQNLWPAEPYWTHVGPDRWFQKLRDIPGVSADEWRVLDGLTYGSQLCFFVEGFEQLLSQKLGNDSKAKHAEVDPDATRIRAEAFPHSLTRAIEKVRFVRMSLCILNPVRQPPAPAKPAPGWLKATITLWFEAVAELGFKSHDGEQGCVDVTCYPGNDADAFLVKLSTYDSVALSTFMDRKQHSVTCRKTGRKGLAVYDPLDDTGRFDFSPWRCLKVRWDDKPDEGFAQPTSPWDLCNVDGKRSENYSAVDEQPGTWMHGMGGRRPLLPHEAPFSGLPTSAHGRIPGPPPPPPPGTCPPPPPPSSSSGRPLPKSRKDPSAYAAAHHATAQAKKGANKVPTGEHHEYACALCADGGSLLLCEGTCMRSFHVECLRNSGIEVPEGDAPFYCDQCQTQSHVCSHCGHSGTPMDPTMRCSMHNCGLHFHLRCVKKLFKYRFGKGNNPGDGEKGFTCHAHYCANCRMSGDALRLKQCYVCRRSFHQECLYDEHNVFSLNTGAYNVTSGAAIIKCAECVSAKERRVNGDANPKRIVRYHIPLETYEKSHGWVHELASNGSIVQSKELKGRPLFTFGTHQKGGGVDFLTPPPVANKLHTFLQLSPPKLTPPSDRPGAAHGTAEAIDDEEDDGMPHVQLRQSRFHEPPVVLNGEPVTNDLVGRRLRHNDVFQVGAIVYVYTAPNCGGPSPQALATVPLPRNRMPTWRGMARNLKRKAEVQKRGGVVCEVENDIQLEFYDAPVDEVNEAAERVASAKARLPPAPIFPMAVAAVPPESPAAMAVAVPPDSP
ncbi:PHD-type domain-containing protein [Pseudoscourfieldia marina]